MATLALVGITFWYARHTKGMLKEMQKSREPAVSIDLSASHYILYILIRNIGITPIHGFQISGEYNPNSIDFLHKSHSNEEPSLFNHPLFKDGIEYLAPGVEYRFRIGRIVFDYCKENKAMVELYISYKSQNQLFKMSTKHCLHDVYNATFKPEQQIVSALSRISNEIRDIGPNSTSNYVQRLSNGKKTIRRCEYCCEEIHETAQKCSHCLEWQGKDLKDENTDNVEQS